MSTFGKSLIVVFTLGVGFSIQAQSSKVKQLFQDADRLDKAGLYGESLQMLNEIIEISEGKNTRNFINASILKAEIFRKTERFSRGITILKELKSTQKYPELHVKKLGRMAAIYRQDGATPSEVKQDTVLKILNEGIRLSQQFELKEEEAGLLNELGYMQSQMAHHALKAKDKVTANELFQKAERNLYQAVNIFREVGDTENELWVMRNILTANIWKDRLDIFKELYPEVLEKLKGTEWYQLQSGIYELIGNVYMHEGDSIKGYYWRDRGYGATANFYAKKNSAQMNAFTNLHDTERFKKDAIEKQAALDRQQYELNQYVYFSIISLLLVLLALVILVRERRLKGKLNRNVKELNVLNEKYEMLVVESNHRIKNNLQMIISMLEFTKKGIGNSRTDIIRSISGKIQTISTLHKHLYIDMHNEFVDLNFYFNELIEQYREMEIERAIHIDIDPIKIRSERIVYFGLILNEMLSNTIEHGSSSDSPIAISVKLKGERWEFHYCDHSSHAEASKEGTGLQLIKGLVHRIGGKEYELDRETGSYRFVFDSEVSELVMAS